MDGEWQRNYVLNSLKELKDKSRTTESWTQQVKGFSSKHSLFKKSTIKEGTLPDEIISLPFLNDTCIFFLFEVYIYQFYVNKTHIHTHGRVLKFCAALWLSSSSRMKVKRTILILIWGFYLLGTMWACKWKADILYVRGRCHRQSLEETVVLGFKRTCQKTDDSWNLNSKNNTGISKKSERRAGSKRAKRGE